MFSIRLFNEYEKNNCVIVMYNRRICSVKKNFLEKIQEKKLFVLFSVSFISFLFLLYIVIVTTKLKANIFHFSWIFFNGNWELFAKRIEKNKQKKFEICFILFFFAQYNFFVCTTTTTKKTFKIFVAVCRYYFSELKISLNGLFHSRWRIVFKLITAMKPRG